MDFLEEKYLGNSVEHWTLAFAIFAASFLILKGIQHLIAVKARISHRKLRIENLVLVLVESTKTFFFAVVAIALALQVVDLSQKVALALEKTLLIAFTLQLGIWFNAIINFYVVEYSREHMTKDASRATTITALSLFAKILAWVLVVLLALNNIGVNITALVAGLGVGGIAVALAVQNILGDLLASLSIIFDKPFVIGDTIMVGEDSGIVEHIGLKTTRLKSPTGEQLIFSNSDILKSRIRNFKRMQERRVQFTLSVDYSVNKEKLEKIPMLIRKEIEALQQTRFERSHFARFTPTTLEFETVYYVQTNDYKTYMDIQEKINLSLLDKFRVEEIKIPPQAAPAPVAIVPKA